MPVSYDFKLVDMSFIKVSKDRQRKKLEKIDELVASIKRNGLLHPIVITRDGLLVSGERRYRAFQQAKIEKIPVHFVDQLDNAELKAIELEENIKRVDLHWKDTCIATFEYHQLRLDVDPDWTRQATSEAIGLTPQYISRLIQVAKELKNTESRIHEATTIDAAYRMIQREQKRAVETEVSQIEENFTDETEPDSKEVRRMPKARDYHVLCEDFNSWIVSYEGRKFNFLHCDFPYGVGYGATNYSGSQSWKKYKDDPDIYWTLLRTLIKNRKRILFPSSHMIFWFSMNFYQPTLEALQSGGFVVNPFPLMWHKDRGIIPDPERGPRRVYETAFLCSTGDRKVIKSPANVKYSPVQKEAHISTKPRAMLEHFLAMFIDDMTEMLDPTCGGGTALASCLSLGAKRVVGLDIEAEYVEATELACRIASKERL